ncbi:uncharacterized protein HD556DRAFT_1481810, partial [Suillus plorans]
GWDEFSNHTAESKGDINFINRGSLEGVQYTVHPLLVGGIHFANYPSALLTWFPSVHHSNVGRLFALWEWCYPEYWTGSGYERDGEQYPWTQVWVGLCFHADIHWLSFRARGTYAQSYNEQHLSDGPLQPFRTERGDYRTSSQARFLHEQSYPKYYSFPEFEGIEVDQAATSFQERASACKKVQTYHGFYPQTNAKQVGLHATKHLPVLNKEDPTVPSDHTIIPCYRTLAVHGKLLEHAYNRFYSFQL